jgi:hypothetical protein
MFLLSVSGGYNLCISKHISGQYTFNILQYYFVCACFFFHYSPLCSKSAVPELCLMKLCKSLRFPEFLRSHYTATSHKPVEAFYSPNSFHTFCIGCFKYITATQSNLWDVLYEWIVQNFSDVEISTEQEIALAHILFLPMLFCF